MKRSRFKLPTTVTIFDFGFWILDFGLDSGTPSSPLRCPRLHACLGVARGVARPGDPNPKSKIQNLKSFGGFLDGIDDSSRIVAGVADEFEEGGHGHFDVLEALAVAAAAIHQ